MMDATKDNSTRVRLARRNTHLTAQPPCVAHAVPRRRVMPCPAVPCWPMALRERTQAQPDDSSVSHGKIAATEPDELCHVRGDVESGRGDSGGGVFSLLSGKLVAVCIGNDPVGNKAVMVPMASVMYFVGMLPAHK